MAEGINEHRVYVGGLDPGVCPVLLENSFSMYGEACNVSLNERRRFGFVSNRHKRGLQDLPAESEPQQQGTPNPGGIQSFNNIYIPTDNNAEPLAFLRAHPEFQQMRQAFRQNPQLLIAVFEQMSQNNPRLLLLICQNCEEFLRMIKEPQGPVVAGTSTSPLESSLGDATVQDRDVIERATAPSTSVTPRISQLQSEPDIHSTGLAIASVSESVEPTEPLAFLLTQPPEFQQVRQRLRQNPQLRLAVLEQIGRDNPRLLLHICQNWEEFLHMLEEPQGPESAQPVVAGTGTSPLESSLGEATAQDEDAIERATSPSTSVTPRISQLQLEPDIHSTGLAIASVPESVEPTEPLAFLRTQSEFRQMRREIRQIRRRIRQVQREIRQMQRDIQQVLQEIRQVLQESRQMRREVRQMRREIRQIRQGRASAQPVVAGTGTSPLESLLGEATAQNRDAIEQATAPSPSDAPRISQLQSEPDIHPTGLAIASVPEFVEPNGAASAKETEVEEKVEVTKVDKKVEETKTVDLQCKICMDEQVGLVFLPCGHLVSCPTCAQRISKCPMCRKRIIVKVRTYLS